MAFCSSRYPVGEQTQSGSDAAVAELAPRIGVRAACDAVGLAQASYYHRHRTSPAPAIFDELHSARFADLAPAEVWAILLDEGRYLGSPKVSP